METASDPAMSHTQTYVQNEISCFADEERKLAWLSAPCPQCKSGKGFLIRRYLGEPEFHVLCSHCSYRTPDFDSDNDAINFWKMQEVLARD